MTSLLKTLFAQCLLSGELCLFTITPAQSQYFSKEYDYDTSYDFGKNVMLLPDGSYRVFDGLIAVTDGTGSLKSFVVSQDGNQISEKKSYTVPGMNSGSYDGRMAVTNTGQLLFPYTIAGKYHYSYQCAILKLNANADSVFIKAYTDTLKNADNGVDVAYDPVHDHYILAVNSLDTTGSLASKNGLLIINDTNGNLITRKVFEKKSVIIPKYPSGVSSSLQSVEVLPNGNILLGAFNRSADGKGYGGTFRSYYHDRPWFILTDSQGNILKDSAYGDAYTAGGNIHSDRLGGYFHWGQLDSIITNNALNFQNFPPYVAALDTNFKIRWLHDFASFNHFVEIFKTQQLRGGDYLILGQVTTNPPETHGGWACRITRYGSVRWERAFSLDTASPIGCLVDAAERPDGSLVMTGMWPRNKNRPSYRLQDVWLLSVDSNGCELPGCMPTAVPDDPKLAAGSYTVYPNPATSQLSISFKKASAAPEAFTLYDITGRLAAHTSLKGQEGKTTISIDALPAGIYLYRITSGDGSISAAGKLSKQ